MLRSRSKVRRNHTELQQIVGTVRDTLDGTFHSGRLAKQNTLHVEQADYRQMDRNLAKRTSGSNIISHSEVSDIQLRARHYLLKYKILDQPEISFSLVNIILEERQRLLDTAEAQNKQQALRSKITPGQLLPPVQQTRTTTIHEERQEVVDLAKWLDCRLEALRKNESITINDILSYKQTVLNLGLSEIIRMVAATCKERASLLRLVWDSTFEIFERVVLIMTRHADEQERSMISNESQLNQLFEERIKGERERYRHLSEQHFLILDHFKSLIIQSRRLKKDNKDMELKYRLLEYSLESYREGYEVALEMALQSGDGNIVTWATKILGKLVKEKRRKKKKFHRVVQDQLVYRRSVDVVLEWVRRHTDGLDESALEKYTNIDLVGLYNLDQQAELELLATKKNTHRQNEKEREVGDGSGYYKSSVRQTDSGKSEINGKATDRNDLRGMDERHTKDIFSEASEKNINIYDYFKLEDVGTCMGIEFKDCGIGEPSQLANKSIQTWSVKTCDATTMTDQSLFPVQLARNLESGKQRQRREGMHTGLGQNISINETDEISGNISFSLKSLSNKKDAPKIRKKLRLNVSSSRSQSRNKNVKITSKVKKNNVKVTRKYHRKRREDTELPVSRSGSTAFIAYDLQVKPRVMHADLQLNKFEEVFEQERERMAKHPQEFMRALQERRSFANFKEVEYGSYCNYEHCVQKWAVLKKDDRPPQNSFNAYNEVSRKLKQYFDKAAVNSNIMKKKIFRQNTQIFLNVAGNVHLAAVRDQKASSTMGALNKILSSLLIEQVKQAKKDKEDKEEKQGDRFFYPLNALYVDKFINTYGLKEIAEKNMVSTLRNIIGLTHRSEKMRLFAILLGVYDRNVGGDELQLYVRSLVYFDTTGKVALQMRDFNIERLSTEKITVQENIGKVVEGFFTAEQTALLLEEILATFQQCEPSIETIVLMLIEAYNRHKAEKVGEYLPLHNYLVNHRTFTGNFIELLKLLALGPDKESQILKCFISNLDLIEESNRCITPQRFLSTCIKCSMPTITEMCSMLVANIQRYEPPEAFSRKVYVQVAEQNIGWLLRVKEQWQLPIQNSLLQELESALQLEDKHLTQFWWLVTISTMLDKHVQDLINRVIGNLNIVTIEGYFNQLKKLK